MWFIYPAPGRRFVLLAIHTCVGNGTRCQCIRVLVNTYTHVSINAMVRQEFTSALTFPPPDIWSVQCFKGNKLFNAQCPMSNVHCRVQCPMPNIHCRVQSHAHANDTMLITQNSLVTIASHIIVYTADIYELNTSTPSPITRLHSSVAILETPLQYKQRPSPCNTGHTLALSSK